jgi:hypothetical protein
MAVDISPLLRKRPARDVVARSPAGRVVVVLESAGGPGIEEAFRLAAERRTAVCILSLGYPQTRAQQDAVSRAIRLSWDTRVCMEAILVTGRRDLRRHLLSEDDVLA